MNNIKLKMPQVMPLANWESDFPKQAAQAIAPGDKTRERPDARNNAVSLRGDRLIGS